MSSSAAVQKQQWHAVLFVAVPAGPEFAPIGSLTNDFMIMQLALTANPHIGDREMQDLADTHNVNAAILGLQADLDMWISNTKDNCSPARVA